MNGRIIERTRRRATRITFLFACGLIPFITVAVPMASYRQLEPIFGFNYYKFFHAHSWLICFGTIAAVWIPVMIVQGHLFLHVRHFKLRTAGGNDLPCPECGFNLHGNRSGACPECGTRFDRGEVRSYWETLSPLGKPRYRCDDD